MFVQHYDPNNMPATKGIVNVTAGLKPANLSQKVLTCTQPETNMLPLLLRSWGHNEFSHTIVKGKEYKVYVTFRPITTSYHTGVSMKEYFVFLCQSLIYVRVQTPHKCPYVRINVFKQCFHWLWNLPFD